LAFVFSNSTPTGSHSDGSSTSMARSFAVLPTTMAKQSQTTNSTASHPSPPAQPDPSSLRLHMGNGVAVDTHRDQRTRSHEGSRAMSKDSSPGANHHQQPSGGSPPRPPPKDPGTSERSSLPGNPPPHNHDNLQRSRVDPVDSHSIGNPHDDWKISNINIKDKGKAPRETSIHETCFILLKTAQSAIPVTA
jgi:hypothetical protein